MLDNIHPPGARSPFIFLPPPQTRHCRRCKTPEQNQISVKREGQRNGCWVTT